MQYTDRHMDIAAILDSAMNRTNLILFLMDAIKWERKGLSYRAYSEESDEQCTEIMWVEKAKGMRDCHQYCLMLALSIGKNYYK